MIIFENLLISVKFCTGLGRLTIGLPHLRELPVFLQASSTAIVAGSYIHGAQPLDIVNFVPVLMTGSFGEAADVRI